MVITTPVGSREAVSAARWPLPEERRTVTVLFVDIVGSTALVERLDPEDVRTLQRVYFGTVAGVLRRWRGVVEKYVGDAVMALFGAPDCDGFDAYRAVRAGLEIQAALDRRSPGDARLRVRVGVATGEVLVDLTGARDGGHGAASGAVITTAARLQEYAPPGAVVVCPTTRRAIAGLVDQRPHATATLAGKAAPLDVWRVTGLSRHRPARHRGPLVGRRRELAGAADAVTRALREHRPRWISLTGPPGSGRSRLLHELTRAVARVDGTAVRWCVTHCPPYPDGDLAPLADLVRALLTQDATGVRPRLPHVGRSTTSPALAAFLATPRDAAAGARAATACRELLLDRAAGGPVVVAVDDLDRAAPALHRFLRQLHATAGDRGLALAVVTTHGAGRADPWSGPVGRRHRVWLPPLGVRETGRLLRHLLDRANRPAALAARLLPLVGGNPGVAAAYATADPADEPAGVPAAVRRLVDARLDALDGRQRAVLMAGAALGGPIVAATVERMLGWPAGHAGPVLHTLAATGLLGRTDAAPVALAGGAGWTIVEPVVTRVAAHRLPRAARADFARRLVGGDPVQAHRTDRPLPLAGARPGRNAGPGVNGRPAAAVRSRANSGPAAGGTRSTAGGTGAGLVTADVVGGAGATLDAGIATVAGLDPGAGIVGGAGAGRGAADAPATGPGPVAARPPAGWSGDAPAVRLAAGTGVGVPDRDADERASCPLAVGRSRRSGGGARPATVPPSRPVGAGAALGLPEYAGSGAGRAGPPSRAAPVDTPTAAGPAAAAHPLERAARLSEPVGRRVSSGAPLGLVA
ncbi:adenylate/guanylate cyclase domain-containing protein [Micromonospora sp. WMMD980]|uniref:AAA family ATPase n=1 Tax=Micromonospora sp. WMMD980 TaxID=3016088 RepID=UPI0024179CB5|nr:adenylate/guanylate cyclase domain-containing protein [Micromonospora sp. WMMD980]MDG4800527.1 adenylate/guanylate cyclase domain-containing protein [Micromonospora sp. WMMD980]